MIDKGVLQEANDVINGERQDTYGSPEDSFQIIADFWTAYLKGRGFIKKPICVTCEDSKCDICADRPNELTKKDIAHMMSLFKHARMIGQKFHRDNYRDACGYLAIIADRLEKNK